MAGIANQEVKSKLVLVRSSWNTLSAIFLGGMMLSACLARPAIAQKSPNLAGTWQGMLNVDPPLCMVVRISKLDTGGWKGTLFSIDEGSHDGVTIQSIALQGSSFKFSIPAIDASYEGTLSADGSSIQGLLTLKDKSPPFNLVRATADTAWDLPEPTKSMPANADPSFDVATIKPSRPDDTVDGYGPEGRHMTVENYSINRLIEFAYGVHRKQLAGGADWLDTDRYDIDGVADIAGYPNEKQMRAMVRKLLTDRFQLTFHREKRELSVYAITVAKGSAKLTKNLGDPNGFPRESGNGDGTGLTVRYTNFSTADFAENLQTMVPNGKPVVDQTGLNGRYDFTLKWWTNETPSSSPDAAPELFTAMQEQLGLKMDSVKAPMDVIVIDHVERPSAN